MLETSKSNDLPTIPRKRYFTIGEVSELCDVKPHVLRYWEQEFPQLNPVKRRGNRRYYQKDDVIIVRKIRQLLYDFGYTIGGARQQFDVLPFKPPASEPLVVEVERSTQNKKTLNLNDIISDLEGIVHILKS